MSNVKPGHAQMGPNFIAAAVTQAAVVESVFFLGKEWNQNEESMKRELDALKKGSSWLMVGNLSINRNPLG